MPVIQTPSRVFAALYDKFNAGPEEAGVAELRRDLLATATGATLEIGAGTGLNLERYPTTVTRLVLTEPDAQMRARLRSKLAENGRDGELVAATAEALPFEDASFDTAVCAMVLCTVPDPPTALAEIRRVLSACSASRAAWRRSRRRTRRPEAEELAARVVRPLPLGSPAESPG